MFRKKRKKKKKNSFRVGETTPDSLRVDESTRNATVTKRKKRRKGGVSIRNNLSFLGGGNGEASEAKAFKGKKTKVPNNIDHVKQRQSSSSRPNNILGDTEYSAEALKTLREEQREYVPPSSEQVETTSGEVDTDITLGEELVEDAQLPGDDISRAIPLFDPNDIRRAKQQRARKRATDGGGTFAAGSDFISLGKADEKRDDDLLWGTANNRTDFRTSSANELSPSDFSTSRLHVSSLQGTTESSLESNWEKSQLDRALASGTLSFPPSNNEDAKKEKNKINYSASFSSVSECAVMLREQMSTLEKSVSKDEEALSEVTSSLYITREETRSLQKEVSQLSEKYVAVQKFADYVRTLIGCIRDKLPKVQQVETALLEIRKDAAGILYEMTRSPNSLLIDAIGSTVEEWLNDANEASLRESLVETEEIFMGNKTSGYSIIHGFGWKKRKQRSSVIITEHDLFKNDILSTLESRRQNAMQASSLIWSDVSKDSKCSTLKDVVEKFIEFRSKVPDAYRDAYFSFSLPELFAAWARVEVSSTWDPLIRTSSIDPYRKHNSLSDEILNNNSGFEQFSWWNVLYHYNDASPSHNDEDSDNEADERIVPKLVELSIFPLLRSAIDNCWDPLYSLQQTAAVVANIAEVNLYHPDQDATWEPSLMLEKSVLKCFEHSISQFNVPKGKEKLNMNNIHSIFNALRLFLGISYYARAIPNNNINDTLRNLATEKLLNEKMIPFLKNITIESNRDGTALLSICDFLIDSIPETWCSVDQGKRHGFPGVQALRELAVLIGDRLE
eukprot:g2747.t1